MDPRKQRRVDANQLPIFNKIPLLPRQSYLDLTPKSVGKILFNPIRQKIFTTCKSMIESTILLKAPQSLIFFIILFRSIVSIK